MKRGRLLTIGSFDGVHRGHQVLLAVARHQAAKRSLKSLALSFQTPPRMVLEPSQRLSLLSDPNEKSLLIKKQGIDEVELLRFSKQFSEIKPFLFFRDVLIRKYNARGIVVGSDFRFGMNRSAGALELVRWGGEFEIPVWVVPPVRWQGKVVSSSFIRQLLEEGRFTKALGFLNHPYLISGKVVRGKGFGSKLGFPTANIRTSPGKILPRGVFVIKASLAGHPTLTGVCNIGVRPTVSTVSAMSVEAHLFNMKRNIVGKTLTIELCHRLRSEKKFASVADLKKAIASDITKARRFLARKPASNKNSLHAIVNTL